MTRRSPPKRSANAHSTMRRTDFATHLGGMVPPASGTVPDSTPQIDPCVTGDRVAEILGVSRRTLDRLIASGNLRKLPMRGAVRITAAELARFLAGKPIEDKPASDDQ